MDKKDENNKIRGEELQNQSIDSDKQEDILELKESAQEDKFQEEILNLKDQVQRLAAENQNMTRRYQNQIADARDYSIMSFAKDLIGVIDNCSRALEYNAKSAESNEEVGNIVKGVELIKHELLSAFEKNSIESIIPQAGEAFDYNLHEAIAREATEEYESGSIVKIMRVGYKIKNRLIRPASVSVASKT
ncbi:MAG: nucleotide exchange factor GrpE [Rickettsiaceae bacterium]|nr:nucleotide exchange factor GrpE [Rickettsiaceae bacterium]